ncbi:hypothetical protein BKA69DRAFT_1037226 [Paraphysoderma sedebokerense]|nr:hypothetical protein BKA69DRAFT_1037226 [Paraphysoderma sedebokerense]
MASPPICSSTPWTYQDPATLTQLKVIGCLKLTTSSPPRIICDPSFAASNLCTIEKYNPDCEPDGWTAIDGRVVVAGCLQDAGNFVCRLRGSNTESRNCTGPPASTSTTSLGSPSTALPTPNSEAENTESCKGQLCDSSVIVGLVLGGIVASTLILFGVLRHRSIRKEKGTQSGNNDSGFSAGNSNTASNSTLAAGDSAPDSANGEANPPQKNISLMFSYPPPPTSQPPPQVQQITDDSVLENHFQNNPSLLGHNVSSLFPIYPAINDQSTVYSQNNASNNASAASQPFTEPHPAPSSEGQVFSAGQAIPPLSSVPTNETYNNQYPDHFNSPEPIYPELPPLDSIPPRGSAAPARSSSLSQFSQSHRYSQPLPTPPVQSTRPPSQFTPQQHELIHPHEFFGNFVSTDSAPRVLPPSRQQRSDT